MCRSPAPSPRPEGVRFNKAPAHKRDGRSADRRPPAPRPSAPPGATLARSPPRAPEGARPRQPPPRSPRDRTPLTAVTWRYGGAGAGRAQCRRRRPLRCMAAPAPLPREEWEPARMRQLHLTAQARCRPAPLEGSRTGGAHAQGGRASIPRTPLPRSARRRLEGTRLTPVSMVRRGGGEISARRAHARGRRSSDGRGGPESKRPRCGAASTSGAAGPVSAGGGSPRPRSRYTGPCPAALPGRRGDGACAARNLRGSPGRGPALRPQSAAPGPAVAASSAQSERLAAVPGTAASGSPSVRKNGFFSSAPVAHTPVRAAR